MSESPSLCESCINKDLVGAQRGSGYELVWECDYGLVMFPNARRCDRHLSETEDSDMEEDWGR